jgi:hypothetical protein
MEGMKALPFFFVLLAGFFSVCSGTSFTLLRFYLSPNCTDNYIGFVYRQDTPDWGNCYQEECHQVGPNFVTRECASDSWKWTNKEASFVRQHLAPYDCCSGNASPEGTLGALPHQCVVVPEPEGGSGAFRLSACDPVTGALAYYDSYFDEPTTDCNNDVLRTTSYPKCGQLNVLAGTAWGFNDCQLNLTSVVPISPPENPPVAPPVEPPPPPQPEPAPVIGPISEPVTADPPQNPSENPPEASSTPVYDPLLPPKAADDNPLSTRAWGIIVAGALVVGIFVGSLVTWLNTAKRAKKSTYETIRNVN